VIDGLTGLVTEFVSKISVYQVAIPVLQVANKAELCPEQIVVGLAEMLVGAVVVGFTLTVTFPETLLHPAALTQAT
jgi:hypothetical protein